MPIYKIHVLKRYLDVICVTIVKRKKFRIQYKPKSYGNNDTELKNFRQTKNLFHFSFDWKGWKMFRARERERETAFTMHLVQEIDVK